MYLPKATLHTALFAVLAAAAPSGLEVRQGGFFVSVGLKYSGPGCVDSTLIFADPIFGNGNVCQPLDRSGTGTPIISYETVSVSPGCSVALYTEPNCGGTAYSAPVDGCVTGSGPFVSTFVTCT